ncbi:receptor-type tyrosine-protein phosphatase kappa-like [Haliotis rubra]|uniref:receptor-type tyrosine-protein phosphatase kappa-like n=1 Tax=Haliotis rubra TaxID=36100 RepID=UPI001EE5B8DF|nr:receptor-type tyrosine-protein phosphatase kappa-like [Haliotis rubra]
MEVSVLGVLLCVSTLDIVSGTCPEGTYGYQCGYQCHCPLEKCNATSGCSPGDCDIGWSGLTCQKSNIALNKSTSASSVYDFGDPGNAVNGDNSASDHEKCFHSDWEDNNITQAWWRVDLGEMVRIHYVTIYFRTKYIVRRNGIQIYIADTVASPTDGVNCYTVTGNINGTDIPDVLNVTCSGEGRYLVLYTITVNNEKYVPIMDFCEVEVDVCSNGTFGDDCANYCHCDGEVCDYVSGICPSGVCLPGWTTAACDTVCQFGYYGANCSKICQNRNCQGDSSSCDHVAGECVRGCTAGWNGTDCTQECLHSYGDGCSKFCSDRKCSESSSGSCDHVTGMCEGGCRSGWKGTDCTEACQVGVEYGAKCSGNCSARMCEGGNDTCPNDSGRCENGCQSGWKGEDCTQVCSFGSFGANCTGVCGQCVDVSTCHHVNGSCLSGCSDGWTDHNCTQKLVEEPPTTAGIIAGSVVAVIVAAAIVVAVVVMRRRRGHHKESGRHTSMVQMQKEEDTEEAGVDNPVPVLGEDEDDVEEDHNATYYNIARAPAVTVVSVDQVGERIKELQVPVGGFQAEYQKLPSDFAKPYTHSQQPENKGKNKYRGYYPYDDTRVVLKELPDQPGSDYINASYIDGYSRPKAYIAAQAPNNTTLTDFLRMIWEQNCTRIVILTNLVEMGRVKCEAYWSDTSDLLTDGFTVSVTSISVRAHWIVRELQVTQRETNTSRCFHHFQFTTWPDHGIPEEMALTEFLWLIRTSRTTQADPLLVHCSAGIGRTGTYIALDYLLDQALAEDAVDVFGCVSGMRDQRKGMIQTQEQYTCVYIALYGVLEFGNTALEVEEFSRLRNMKKVFKIGRMSIPKLIQILNSERESQTKTGAAVKGRVWINGRSDIMAVMTPSYLSVNGYLLTDAPSVTTASLFWKLTEEQESSTVIVLPDSHQRLSSCVPSEGDSLDLSPVKVRCSTESTISPGIALRNIHRQIENSTPTLVDVYILNKSPHESQDTVFSLLEQLAYSSPVTVVYQDNRQNAAMLCILSNIVQGLKYDKRAEVYNNMRAMVHCLDQDITVADVALCYDVAAAYMESESIYANM